MKQIENSPQGNTRFTFEGKLTKIGTTILQNSNGKNYKIVDIEFADVNGEVQKSSAAVYEGNYSKGIEVGKSYLTTATIVGTQPYLQMSHLEANAGRASVSMFLAEVAAAATKIGALQS